MQPDHEQSFHQIVLNRAPMLTEHESEPGKSPLDTSLTAGQPCDDQRDVSNGKVRNDRKAIGATDHLMTLSLPEAGL
jgi:hypothetical protein